MSKQQIMLLSLLLGIVITLTTAPGRKIIMSALEKIKELVSREEGLRLTVYQDQAGKWTIGYGHLIKPGEKFYPYGPIKTITREEADKIFAQDIAEAEACVKNNVHVPLTENQYAALVSFVFNVGCNAFRQSTLRRYLNARDPRAADEFKKWVYATKPSGEKIWLTSLVNRRLREHQLFTT